MVSGPLPIIHDHNLMCRTMLNYRTFPTKMGLSLLAHNTLNICVLTVIVAFYPENRDSCFESFERRLRIPPQLNPRQLKRSPRGSLVLEAILEHKMATTMGLSLCTIRP